MTDAPSPEVRKFADQLAELPCIPDSGGPRVWGWGHSYAPWDVDNPEHWFYAKAAGGVLASAHHGADVYRAATVAHAADAHLGLRVHPYHSKKFWRAEEDPPGPDYLGPELVAEHERVCMDLRRALHATERVGVKVRRVLIDVETWIRDSPRAADRGLWNAEMYLKHINIVEVVRRVFGTVPVEFYNKSPVWRICSLNEPGPASFSMYRPEERKYDLRVLEETVKWQEARGLASVTAHVSIGAGWLAGSGRTKWERNYQYDPDIAYSLGETLRRTHAVHNVVEYTAFYDDKFPASGDTAWRGRILPFFRGLLGQ